MTKKNKTPVRLNERKPCCKRGNYKTRQTMAATEYYCADCGMYLFMSRIVLPGQRKD